ncbi:metallophosphoesterase [Adhaeribacter aerolatus]|nr:metallophosphoesterase [Adhaeribacter aerolatus]
MKHQYLAYCLSVVFLFFVNACAVKRPFYSSAVANWQTVMPPDSSRIKYTVFLIGDVGAPEKDPLEPSLKLLESQMKSAGANSATVFLGDNIYSYGLTEAGSPGRKTDEERLTTQLDRFKGYQGEKYMIAGNHDWAQGLPGGLRSVIRQEVFVEEYLKDSTFVSGGDFFVPDEGCPGPYEVYLQEDVVFIALNSQWWLQEEERPYGPNNYCNVADEVEVLTRLEDIIARNNGKHIVVVGHHPLFSNGVHGGNFQLLDHIFPLTLIEPWLVLPLPVIGSIYPWARKYGGISQDIAHPKYQAYVQGLMNIFQRYPNVVYAGGHEHNIQHFKHGNVNTIVSGSGCKIQHMKLGGGDALFGHEAKGYAKVNYYDNGEAWVEFWEPVNDGSTGKLFFRTQMYTKQSGTPVATPIAQDKTPALSTRNYRDSTITLAANPIYQAGKLKEVFLGEHYRDVWATPVKMPYLDLRTEKSGLRPYRVGGGKQTISLRLRNEEGHEYTLRSVNKNPTQVLPKPLQETIARDLMQDQISAQHPYGALVLPPLAKAAGVFHVNPELFYIPSDPALGQYRNQFAGTVAILEENPDESHENVASLGNALNLVGTDKVLERKIDNNDNTVDEPAFARARLFDMLIGDWDRHEGQWRWAESKTEDGRLFTPVPKDRDAAFFKTDGLLPYLATRKWGIRNFQNFGYDFGDYIGLNLSALTNDHTFLSRVTKAEWVGLAEKMKANVTDEVIEAALKQFPPEVYAQSAPEIAAKLKSRRDMLPQLAADYYAFLAKTVDVAGSNRTEYFKVNRRNDKETEVEVRNIKLDGTMGRKLYERTFYTDETNEIRLYGLGGKDIFEVTGEVGDGILIRIIGGDDRDSIADNSSVGGLRRKTVVYDTKDNNVFHFGSETKDRTEAAGEVNIYSRTEHKVPYLGPRLALQYNVDDQLYLGGGLVYRRYKFRKEPFAVEHSLLGNYAFATGAYNLRYKGIYTDIIKDWDLDFRASINGPQLLANYFGQGNETEANEENIRDYRVRFKRYIVTPTLTYDIFHFLKIGVGPTYDQFQVQRESTGPAARALIAGSETDASSFRMNEYIGARAFMNVVAVSNEVNPYIGIKWLNEFSVNQQLGYEKYRFTRLSSEVMFYLTPNFPFKLTWAGRIGGAHNFGDYRFYQSNTLGGTTNLRGYRITRFAGRSNIYANAEARIHLTDFNFYLFPGTFGILALVDHGRVFADDDASKKLFKGLHRGVGGGIWVDVLRKAVVSGTYSFGEKERLFNLNLGFLF